MANPAFRLQDAGFSREQVDALSDWIDGAAATKADLLRTEAALKEEIAEVRGEIAETKAELKEEIAEVRGEIAEVRGEIAEVRKELQYIKWIGGLILAAIIGQWIVGTAGL